MKYLITLWIDDYDYDGLTQYFKILYETTDKEKGLRKLNELADKTLAREEERVNQDDYPKYKPVDCEDWKIPIFISVNKNNKVIKQLKRKLLGGDFYKIYYYFDLIEAFSDAPIDESLFNTQNCEYEVREFFKEKGASLKQ